ncbi:MAG: CDP-alcohol phosphatidyltransferase family protein [Candidatus Diapherotrites archaeon]|nr:CDP-alcohol phosphatidyltransferase family protein [Candidatus Diapherotrites archaeon]
MLYEKREFFNKISIKVGLIFSTIPLTPNQWTILSLIPAILSAYFIIYKKYLFAIAFFLIAAFLDFVDGSVARVLGRETKFGAYLDTIVDRYVEFIIIFSFLFVDLPDFIISKNALLFLYLFGAFMTTYAKAAAKEKELVKNELKGGLLERAERLFIFFVGLILLLFDSLYFVILLAILAILSNITALQRILKARQSKI